MRVFIISVLVVFIATGCDKVGVSGVGNQLLGNWAAVKLPPDCKVKMIAGESGNGVILLCEDGRVFH